MTIKDMPNFIKREIDLLQEILSPSIKKASRYVFWSFPLISISLFHLFLLLFFPGTNETSVPTLVFYAIIGALGMALSKEGKRYQAHIKKISVEYIVNRINKSEQVLHSVKEHYIHLVKEQPLKSMNYFVEFLEKEHRNKEY